MTALPHIAGQDQNSKLADEIYDNWTKLKFDKVERIEYSVLLQYPNDTNPNKFQIVNGSGDVLFDAPTAKLEPALTVDENQSGVARPFNAYSGSGSAQVCAHTACETAPELSPRGDICYIHVPLCSKP